jgi:hypothetical protein
MDGPDRSSEPGQDDAPSTEEQCSLRGLAEAIVDDHRRRTKRKRGGIGQRFI